MHPIAVALVSGALLATACTSSRTEPHDANTDRRVVTSFLNGRWVALSNQPGVDDLVWSGRELLLYGREGDAALPSIRVLDPTTQGVRSVAVPGPDRNDASTTWTGREFLVIGGRPTRADLPLPDLAYEPTTNRWRELAPSPLAPRSNAPIAWTGREAIVLSGFDASPGKGSESPASGAAAYDPATDTWRVTADPPDITAGDNLVNKTAWTGTEVVVWGERRATTNAIWAAYNPLTNTWRELAPPPPMALGERLAWAVHSNGRVIALGYLGHAATLDLASNQWQHLPDFLNDKHLIVPQLITIGDQVIGILGEPRLLSADRSTWQIGPTAPDIGGVTRLAWTGRELYAVDIRGGFAKYIPPDAT